MRRVLTNKKKIEILERSAKETRAAALAKNIVLLNNA